LEVEFLGATREVTGSCTMIRVAGKCLLVDCGLLQGSNEYEGHNRDEFDFDAAEIDAVVLSHAHIDHSGRLPLLVKRGFRGKIYCHNATLDLCEVMLSDAGYLNEREVEWQNRKRHQQGLPPLAPLYSLADARRAHRQFSGIRYDTNHEILPGVSVTLLDAGHILGSSIVVLDLRDSGRHRRVVFSGDLGHTGAPILRDPTPVDQADLVVLESTYGDRQHRDWQATWDEMGSVLGSANANRGNVLIPSFTVGRAQELLYIFKRYFQEWGLAEWQIFLDSPMAIEATEIYARHHEVYDRKARELAKTADIFDLPNLQISETAEDSRQINMIKNGAIVIAGSGMCSGGRIKHHLKYNVSRKDTQIIIVGFQARGTPGRALVDGAKQIRLFGQETNVLAKVHTIGGLSAHADQSGLANWVSQFSNSPPIYLNHGEESAMTVLQQHLRTITHSDVTLAEHRQVVPV
jgi:metallo-beta-lactamase family protein